MYKIGQVLYIIAGKSKTVEPVKVVRKQTDETVDGTTIQHVCEGVTGDTFSLEAWKNKDLLVGVFERLEDARNHLLHLATEMVDRLVDRAKNRAQEKFGTDHTMLFVPPTSETNLSDETPAVEYSNGELPTTTDVVVLEDGTKARVHFPPELQ